MRLFRGLSALSVGALAGFAGAAAVLRRVLPSRGGAESDEIALVAIFDGVELESRAARFRGGSMLAWFGGIAADLRQTTLASEAHLSLTALLGGIAIRVPAGWRVESNLRAVGGGVNVDVPEPDDPQPPRLVLEGFALLGGVDVRAQAPLPGKD
jgi:hypothetical protein